VDKDEDGDVAMGAAEDPYTSEAATKKKEQDGSDSIVYDRASRESSISPWDGQEEDLVDYSD
jgi:hypothetical protein